MQMQASQTRSDSVVLIRLLGSGFSGISCWKLISGECTESVEMYEVYRIK